MKSSAHPTFKTKYRTHGVQAECISRVYQPKPASLAAQAHALRHQPRRFLAAAAWRLFGSLHFFYSHRRGIPDRLMFGAMSGFNESRSSLTDSWIRSALIVCPIIKSTIGNA